MIYCYEINNEDDFNKYKNYKDVSDDPDNHNRLLRREKWQELEYFKHNSIFWNSEKRIFTERDFSLVLNIDEDDIIFPRVSVPHYKMVAEDILDCGLNIISKPYEFNSIELWPTTLPEKFKKRKIIITTKKDVNSNMNYYFDLIKNDKDQFFIKSIKKDFHYAGVKLGWFDTGMALTVFNDENELVMFSEYLNIEEDDNGTLEYRCFFINGVLKSISRYFDYIEHYIPKDIVDYAEVLCKEVVGKYLPKSVVIDVAKTDRGIIVLEANDVCTSGRYIGNTLESFKIR